MPGDERLLLRPQSDLLDTLHELVDVSKPLAKLRDQYGGNRKRLLTLTISFFSATERIEPAARRSVGIRREGVRGTGLGTTDGSIPRVSSEGKPRDFCWPRASGVVEGRPDCDDWVREWLGRGRTGVTAAGESTVSPLRGDLVMLPARMLGRRAKDAPNEPASVDVDDLVTRAVCSTVTWEGGEGPTDPRRLWPGGTTVADDDVDDPELAREPASSRPGTRPVRWAAAHALESRRVSEPSSSSFLSSGEDGTGVSVVAVLDPEIRRMLEGVAAERDGVWNPRLGFAGLRGVCGTKGRPVSPSRVEARNETSEAVREWAGDGIVMSSVVAKDALDASPTRKLLPMDEVEVEREGSSGKLAPMSGIVIAPSGKSQK